MIALEPGQKRPEYIKVRVRRQDAPDQKPYWELHQIKYEPELNVISVLQKIAAQATNSDGKKVARLTSVSSSQPDDVVAIGFARRSHFDAGATAQSGDADSSESDSASLVAKVL